MEFISTKGMIKDNAPEGIMLVKYLEPSWGAWNTQYTMAYFDNPNDYENECDGEGWKHDITGNKINVISYCKLPEINQKTEDPFFKEQLDQKKVKQKYGTFTPHLGCVGE